MIKENCIVVTGGPGMGKTSLIEYLHKKGYRHIPETGRKIIQQQSAQNGDALPWANRLAFANLMFEQSLADYLSVTEQKTPVFFDRGIPDVMGYLQLCQLDSPSAMNEAISQYRYHPVVFITPPWPAIYQQDIERKQSFEEAVQTYNIMYQLYTNLGYQLIELPKDTIEIRAAFIESYLY